MLMKPKTLIFSLFLLFPAFLFGDIHQQAGVESFMGTNSLFSLNAWIGLRVGISPASSLIFKYYNHKLSFSLPSEEWGEETIKSTISNFTLVFYHQREKFDFHSALSYLDGSRAYKGYVFQAGITQNISPTLSVMAGVYLLRESSVLWYPHEETRNINLYSVNGGLKIKIKKWVSLNPNLYFYRNSEEVNAVSYSIGLIFLPKEPIYITLYYWHYSESAVYRFAGDYISAGFHLYF